VVSDVEAVSLFVGNLSHPDPRGRVAVCLQLAGLLATGLLIAQASPFLSWTRIPLARLVLQASSLSVFAWMAAAGATLGLYVLCDTLFFQDWGAGEISRAAMRTAATAVWLVPATVLASVRHPGALAAAAVLVHNVTRLLYWQWNSGARTEEPTPAESGLFLAAAGARAPLVRDLAPRLAVSLCLQACIAAMLLREYQVARALFYAGTAMITVLVLNLRNYRPETARSIWRSAAGLVCSLLLAGGLTIGSLAPRARGGDGAGSGQAKNGGAYPTALTPEPGSAPQRPDNPTGESFPNDSFPGVILWPEIQPVPTLIAPIPKSHGNTPSAAPMRPFTIPFSGEYWMFRWPYARPPHNSYLKRGNPAALSFRTTDHRPLQMEAHHKLDQAIDIRCCSRIEMAIRDSDHHPGAISLELVLLNTEVRPASSQSLGTAAVRAADNEAGTLQTVAFQVPANSAVSEFNEFQVNFIRDAQRMDRSAKIAIERFVLVPK
jgi:hypothetical protein